MGTGTATITVVAAIVPGQTFTATCPVTMGQPVGTVVANGSPTAFRIVSGNYFGYYAIDNSGVLSIANPNGVCGTTTTLGVQATYASGLSSSTVLVGVQLPAGVAAYLLLVPHYLLTGYAPAGTVVVEGGAIPVGWVPTLACDPQGQTAIQNFWNAGPPEDAEPNRDLYWSAPPIQKAAVFWVQVGPRAYQLTGAGASLGVKANA
jgi:hypothetical protein